MAVGLSGFMVALSKKESVQGSQDFASQTGTKAEYEMIIQKLAQGVENKEVSDFNLK